MFKGNSSFPPKIRPIKLFTWYLRSIRCQNRFSLHSEISIFFTGLASPLWVGIHRAKFSWDKQILGIIEKILWFFFFFYNHKQSVRGGEISFLLSLISSLLCRPIYIDWNCFLQMVIKKNKKKTNKKKTTY